MPFLPNPNPPATTSSNPSTTIPGPYTLLTVNTAPERAFRIIGQFITQPSVQSQITLQHIGNVDTIEDVAPAVKEHQPDVLFSASMWTAEQVAQLQREARGEKGDLVMRAIPQGLQVQKGPEGVLEFLVGNVQGLVEELRTRDEKA